MYVLTDACSACGESTAVCDARMYTASYQTGHEARRKCCPDCPGVAGQHPIYRAEIRVDSPAPLAQMRRGAPLDPDEEDRVVAAYRAAAEADDGVERAGHLSVTAYRSLAESRGVPLEAVVRAACRGELADVIRRDTATTTHTDKGA